MNLFIFSVSTTLKSYLIIMAWIIRIVNLLVLLYWRISRKDYIVSLLHFTKLNIKVLGQQILKEIEELHVKYGGRPIPA